MLYLPKGIAHGFITTKTNTEVSYMHSTKYNKDYSDGFNIFDKKIKFKMKDKIKVISKKDKKLKYINAL